MKDTLISFETAKLAKEKGFDLECKAAISSKTRDVIVSTFGTSNSQWANISLKEYPDLVSAPTQSLLQKWLREKHKIDIWLGKGGSKGDKYHAEDITKNNIVFLEDSEMFNTYEQALEKGLYQALMLIK